MLRKSLLLLPLFVGACNGPDPWIGLWQKEVVVQGTRETDVLTTAVCESAIVTLDIRADGTFEREWQPVHNSVFACRWVPQTAAYVETGWWSTFVLSEDLPMIGFVRTERITQRPSLDGLDTTAEFDQSRVETWHMVAEGDTDRYRWIWMSDLGQYWESP